MSGPRTACIYKAGNTDRQCVIVKTGSVIQQYDTDWCNNGDGMKIQVVVMEFEEGFCRLSTR